MSTPDFKYYELLGKAFLAYTPAHYFLPTILWLHKHSVYFYYESYITS